MKIFRSFISVELSEIVKKKIEKIQQNLPEFKGKKTEIENLHLTLKFLGEIDGEKLEKTREKLREIKLNKFEAEVKNIGVFNNNFIKIIWVYLANCDELQKEVDKKLENLFKKEERFMGHITIARVKKVEDQKKFLDELKKIKIDSKKFIVDKFYLKESILHKDKPEYKVVEEYKLD